MKLKLIKNLTLIAFTLNLGIASVSAHPLFDAAKQRLEDWKMNEDAAYNAKLQEKLDKVESNAKKFTQITFDQVDENMQYIADEVMRGRESAVYRTNMIIASMERTYALKMIPHLKSSLKSLKSLLNNKVKTFGVNGEGAACSATNPALSASTDKGIVGFLRGSTLIPSNADHIVSSSGVLEGDFDFMNNWVKAINKAISNAKETYLDAGTPNCMTETDVDSLVAIVNEVIARL